jgi:hypothetical protein
MVSYAMQPEARIVKKIQALITKQGGRCFKIHGGDNPFQEAGIPDILACYRGWFIGLEVKQPGEEPSPLQRKVLNEIERAGGIALVVSTVAEVASLLAKLKGKR